MIRLREVMLILALFGVLILFVVYGPSSSTTDAAGERGSARSSGDDGALALQRWFNAMGYRAVNFEYQDWQLPDEAAVLLILQTVSEPIQDEEAEEILRWVRQGGTLISVDERPGRLLAPNRLWQALQVTATISNPDVVEPAERATPAQPLLISPAVESVPVNTVGGLVTEDPAFVTLLRTRFGPTLIGRQEGRGYIYLGVSLYPFTNAGLREPGSGALVLNLLNRAPEGATILFDEYHHGFTSSVAAAPPTLRDIALSQWWGWAGLYSVLVVALYLVLTGRRFGSPVPRRQEIARRSSAEYVQSLADLLRRGRKQAPVAQHYHSTLKRRLARPFGFVPPPDDDAFVRALQDAGGATEEQAESLRRLLRALSRPDIDDAELMLLVRRADALVDHRGRLLVSAASPSALERRPGLIRSWIGRSQ
jgi:hypothetical protein